LPCQIAQADFRLRLGGTLQQLEGFLDGGRLVGYFLFGWHWTAEVFPGRIWYIVHYDEQLVCTEYYHKCQANLKLDFFNQ